MSYPKGHNDAVRQRILREARKAFNLKGFDGVTIDEIMKAAGLTRGAFYFHFPSKTALYRAAVAFVLEDHPVKRWMPGEKSKQPLARRLVNAYLSERHLEEMAESCPLITHAAETARSDAETKAVFASILLALVTTLGAGIDIKDRAGNNKGLAVAALCVGGLSLARGVDDPKLARRLLKATRHAATELAGWADDLKSAAKPS